MCSVGEDDFGDDGGLHAMLKEVTISNNVNIEKTKQICQKCKKCEVVVKLNFREAECVNCFLNYVRHKFRATLGSSKVLPKNAEVLLIFDGTAESIVLLEMMHFAHTQNSFKRLSCNTKILYIEDLGLNSYEPDDKLFQQKIRPYLQKFNFKTYIGLLGTHPPKIINLENISSEFKLINESFKSSLTKVNSITSRQDYIQHIRSNLIRSAAEQLDCNFIFLPDVSTNLAASFLTNISLGRGASTALDISLLDDRISEYKIIRPIKDLNDLEIKSYLRVSHLTAFKSNYFEEYNDDNESIKNATKQFVNELQNEYSATVSTIFRTGDKIAPNNNDTENESDLTNELRNNNFNSKLCTFCHFNLEFGGSKTLLAVEFSRLISENSTNANTEKLNNNAEENLFTIKDGETTHDLCRACANIYKDCFDIKLFS